LVVRVTQHVVEVLGQLAASLSVTMAGGPVFTTDGYPYSGAWPYTFSGGPTISTLGFNVSSNVFTFAGGPTIGGLANYYGDWTFALDGGPAIGGGFGISYNVPVYVSWSSGINVDSSGTGNNGLPDGMQLPPQFLSGVAIASSFVQTTPYQNFGSGVNIVSAFQVQGGYLATGRYRR